MSAAEPNHLAHLTQHAPNPQATAVVAQVRQKITDIFVRYGCGHFQIGRAYPYRESRDAGSVALLDAIKTAVDPSWHFNPGGLGFQKHG